MNNKKYIIDDNDKKSIDRLNKIQESIDTHELYIMPEDNIKIDDTLDNKEKEGSDNNA
jgi:hypothetical protein